MSKFAGKSNSELIDSLKTMWDRRQSNNEVEWKRYFETFDEIGARLTDNGQLSSRCGNEDSPERLATGCERLATDCEQLAKLLRSCEGSRPQ